MNTTAARAHSCPGLNIEPDPSSPAIKLSIQTSFRLNDKAETGTLFASPKRENQRMVNSDEAIYFYCRLGVIFVGARFLNVRCSPKSCRTAVAMGHKQLSLMLG